MGNDAVPSKPESLKKLKDTETSNTRAFKYSELPPIEGDDPIRFIYWRNAWNMDVSQKSIIIAGISLLCNLLLIAVLLIVILAQKKYFFSIDPEGHVRPVPALGTPEVSDAEVLSFARNAVVNVYTFDFVNWREQLSKAFHDLSDHAAQSWVETLNDNGILPVVKKDRLVLQCVPTGVPIIEATGLSNGRYSWKISMPATISYYSATERKDQAILATLLISRVVASADHMNGIEVESITTSNAMRSQN